MDETTLFQMKKQGQDIFQLYNQIQYNGDFQELNRQIIALLSTTTQNQHSNLFKQISYGISPQLKPQQLLKYLYGLNFLIDKLGEDHNLAMDAAVNGFNKLFAHQQQCKGFHAINLYYVAQYLQVVQAFFKQYYQIHQNAKFAQYLMYLIQHDPSKKLLDILIQNVSILQLLVNNKAIFALIKQIMNFYEWNTQQASQLIGLLLPNKKELFAMIETDLNIQENIQIMRVIQSVLTYSQLKHKINIEKAIKLITDEISNYQRNIQLNKINKEHNYLLNKVIYCIFSQPNSFVIHKHKIQLLETFYNIYDNKITLVNEYPFTIYDQLQQANKQKSEAVIDNSLQLSLSNLNISTNDCVFGSDSFFMLRYVLERWEVHGSAFLNKATSNLLLLNSIQCQQYLKRQNGKNIDQLCFEALCRAFATLESRRRFSSELLMFLNRINNFYPFNQFNNLIQYVNRQNKHENFIINNNIQLLRFHSKEYYLNFYKQKNENEADAQEQIFNGVEHFDKYIHVLEQIRKGGKGFEHKIIDDKINEIIKPNDIQPIQEETAHKTKKHINSIQQIPVQAKSTQSKQLQLLEDPNNEDNDANFQLVFK